MSLRNASLPLAFAFLVGFTAWVHAVRSQAATPAGDNAEPVVVPYLLESVRVPGVAIGSILVANVSADDTGLVIESISVQLGDDRLAGVDVDRVLPKDLRYARAQALLERLPSQWTHRDGRPRAFAPRDAATFVGDEALARWAELDELALELHRDEAAGRALPFVEPRVALPYDQVFSPWDLAGSERTLAIHVQWRRGANSGSTIVPHVVRLLPARLESPSTLALGTATIHPGDLHVHSCHGEATGACAPSANCSAESLQLSGSFSYAELRTQFTALGLDWFTATDHSYCINSVAEFDAMNAECLAATDGSFLVPMDMELSSAESGPQIGSDSSNILCLFGDSQNHTGAHGLTQRIPGGSDGFAGFCNGVADFDQNATTVRAQGGFPIVHHPAAGSFAWNSRAATFGQEAKQLHGVEIWNGATPVGQGSHVADWVDWLLDGRVLFAYSGSDTHDQAFDFGANHAVFRGEPFTEAGLFSVLERGRVFLSNGPVAILEVGFEGTTLEMGALQALAPGQAATTVDVDVHVDLGASLGTVTIFRGRVGDAGETVVATSALLSGATVFSHSESLDPARRTWFRAYVESDTGAEVAYTNPVFFLPGSCALQPFGVGVGGSNTASLSSPSSPTLGSQVRLDLAGFGTAPFALLVQSNAQLAPFAFGGGFLLVQPPFSYQELVPLSGGAGETWLSVPSDDAIVGLAAHFQAGAPTGLAGSFRFSNGLTATVCDLLQ
ncbi:MAG: CehA/McbA family metallohydrolase [Planctomycetota bacterium]